MASFILSTKPSGEAPRDETASFRLVVAPLDLPRVVERDLPLDPPPTDPPPPESATCKVAGVARPRASTVSRTQYFACTAAIVSY